MEKTHSFKSWLIATRPWSFPASVMPVVVTIAYMFYVQGSSVDWVAGVWAAFTIVAFHAAGNTWSDYHDFKKGVDQAADNVGGTSLTSGEFRPAEILRLSIGLIAVAIVFGILIVIYRGLPILYFGIAGLVLTLLYPVMKYNALGDVDIFLTYSLLPILATTYVVGGALYFPALWLTLPLGLITVAILHINNLRDMESDRSAGIRTLAMLAGRRRAAYMYCVEIFLPFVWIVGMVALGELPLWSLIVLLATVPALKAAKKALRSREEGKSAVVGLDERTAQLQLVFSLLLTVSFLVGGVVK